MKAVALPHFKNRLQDISRELFIEHGWQMPRGLMSSEESNPLNFTQAEWQQAKRIERDPKRIKQIFKECWAASDSGPALKSALESRGYYLAQGERRGYVAVDWLGEVYALARWCGVRTKDCEERLGDPAKLPSVEAVKEKIAAIVAAREKVPDDLPLEFDKAKLALKAQRAALVRDQRIERKKLSRAHEERWRRESIERASRLRRGLLGLWDWVTGNRSRTLAKNEAEIARLRKRDQNELETLINAQLSKRRELQTQVRSIAVRSDRQAEISQRSSGPALQVPSKSVPYRPSRLSRPHLTR
jgi:hypothetical protein